MRRLIPLISLALPLSIPTLAAAEPHEGLLLRVTPGLSGAAASATVDDAEYSLRGGAGRLGLAAGWAIEPRWILTAELVGQAVLGPELDVDGDVTEAGDDVSWGISYLGLGSTYYLPMNLYFAGSSGPLVMTVEHDDEERETDLGFAGKLAIGHEWWVTSQWGLGLAAEVLVGRVPDGDAAWTLATVGLAVSATFN